MTELKNRLKAIPFFLALSSIVVVSSWVFGVNDTYAADCQNRQTITLNTQADVNNFQTIYGNGGICDTVKWSLTIEGADITNLDGLSAITNVGRNLTITNSHALTDISGLSSVVSVGSLLTIDNNDSLRNLNGLTALKTTTVLYIYGNDAIEDIDGLSGLEIVGQDLSLGENGSLANVDGLTSLTTVGRWLQIVACNSLTSVGGLSALATTDGFFIQDNSALTDLNGLVALTHVADLRIERNLLLTTLEGLSAVSSELQNIEIRGNPLLENLDGLDGISGFVTSDLAIDDNPSLSSVSALVGITGAGYLRIMNNDDLINLSGLSGIGSLESLYIGDNDSLESIEALAGVSGSMDGFLTIGGNPVLSNIDALARITEIRLGLNISGNDAMQDVNGLVSLSSVGQDVSISNNRELTQVNGLISLVSVGDIELSSGGGLDITSNPQLRECAGLIPLLDDLDDGEAGPGPLAGTNGPPDVERSIFINFNHDDCNSIQSILQTETSAELAVSKTYSNDNPTPVDISLECELSTTLISALDGQASPESDAAFELRRFIPGFYASCDARENQVPVGYIVDDSDCQGVEMADEGSHDCSILNQQEMVTVTVSKSYIEPVPDGAPEVAITLTCPSGEVLPSSTITTDNGVATFEFVDYHYQGEVCTANERIEPGYLQVDSSGCDDLEVMYGTSTSCTFINDFDPEVIFADGYEG